MASGETEIRKLGKGFGSAASGLSLQTTRRAPESALAQSDLEDEWADDPGASRATPLLLKPADGPGSAVVAPPSLPGTPRKTPALQSRLDGLMGQFGRTCDTNPAVNAFFGRFCAPSLCGHRDTAEKWGQLRDDIMVWHGSGGGLGSRGGGAAVRDDMLKLVAILEQTINAIERELGTWSETPTPP